MLDKIKDIDLQSKVPSGELDLFGDSFAAPSSTEDSWTKRLRTLARNAGVDRGSVGIDLSECDTDSMSNEDSLENSNRSKKLINDEAIFKKLKNNFVIFVSQAFYNVSFSNLCSIYQG